MTGHITDSNNSLEAGSLTSHSLLLDGDDLHDIVLELEVGGAEKFVDDLGLLDGDGVGVDLLEGHDLAGVNQSSELGLGDPLILGGTTTATGATATTTASAAEASVASVAAALTALAATASFSGS